MSRVAPCTAPAGRRARRLRGLIGDQRGTQTLEFALLLAAVVVPMMAVFRTVLDWMVAHYQMITYMNGWPFP